jgi:hypothetical protein
MPQVACGKEAADVSKRGLLRPVMAGAPAAALVLLALRGLDRLHPQSASSALSGSPLGLVVV